jgi:cell shape-determining protein MreC
MATIKDYKLAQKSLLEQQEIVSSLQTLIADIERCENTIVALQTELEQVNRRHAERKTTRDDIAYLTDLLKCANRKLAWEKQIASLQKRTPDLLLRMTAVLNDEKNPPTEEIRASMLSALQGVQAAMERLQQIKPA